MNREKMNDEDLDRIFSDAQLRKLAALARIRRSRQKSFSKRLEVSAEAYFRSRDRQNRPAPSQIIKHLKAVEAACNRLHRLIAQTPSSSSVILRSRCVVQAQAASYAKAQEGDLPGATPIRAAWEASEWIDTVAHSILLIGEFSEL